MLLHIADKIIRLTLLETVLGSCQESYGVVKDLLKTGLFSMFGKTNLLLICSGKTLFYPFPLTCIKKKIVSSATKKIVHRTNIMKKCLILG